MIKRVKKETELLYHGSPFVVKHPEIIIEPTRRKDFGDGFYCTTSYTQAEKWTKAKLRKANKESGYVNIFHLSSEYENLNILDFGEHPSIPWLDFIISGRTKSNFEHGYDIVKGPVANDDAFAEIEAFVAEGDFSTEKKHELIQRLKPYKLRDQILFHTDRSLQVINFLDANRVTIAKKTIKAQSKNYKPKL